MNEIKCPKCGTIFQINESDYNSIVKQVKDQEFTKELTLRENILHKDKENALKLMELNYNNSLKEKNIEINKLEEELQRKEEQIKDKLNKEYSEKINKQLIEINELKNKVKLQDTEKELAIKDALIEKDKTINNLNNKLENKETEYLLKEKNIKDNYEEKIKSKDEQIAYYKDLKARQSTKMIGETLENHCHNEFNKLRPLFPNAYFEKDNDVKTGSKGDFIFRDYDDENMEIVSIMFEMKNEADETQSKHKNEDFLKELDSL